MTGADVNAPSTWFATGPASEERGAKLDNSPAKVWGAENDGTGRLRAAKTGRCESSTNGVVVANSILSLLESAPETHFRGAVHYLWRHLNRNGFLNAITNGG